MTKYKNTLGEYFSPKKVASPAKDSAGDADKQKAITALQFDSPKKASPMKTSPLKSNDGSEVAGCMIPGNHKSDAVAGTSTSYGALSSMKECMMEGGTSSCGTSGSATLSVDSSPMKKPIMISGTSRSSANSSLMKECVMTVNGDTLSFEEALDEISDRGSTNSTAEVQNDIECTSKEGEAEKHEVEGEQDEENMEKGPGKTGTVKEATKWVETEQEMIDEFDDGISDVDLSMMYVTAMEESDSGTKTGPGKGGPFKSSARKQHNKAQDEKQVQGQKQQQKRGQKHKVCKEGVGEECKGAKKGKVAEQGDVVSKIAEKEGNQKQEISKKEREKEQMKADVDKQKQGHKYKVTEQGTSRPARVRRPPKKLEIMSTD